jgi:glycerol-3-phosphate dehydrogenase
VFRSKVVINCAGPWCGQVARALDRAIPEMDRVSMAFSLLLDHEPVSDIAVAVAPRRAGARTYFLVPWRGQVLAGTYHAAWGEVVDDPRPTDEQIDHMLRELSEAVPTMRAAPDRIGRVFCGLLPAAEPGSAEAATGRVYVDHAARGGPRGLHSILGVKYTTSRSAAEHTLRQVFGARPYRPRTQRPAPDPDWIGPPINAAEQALQNAARGGDQAMDCHVSEEPK